MRRIPETDLARIVGRPSDEQRVLLAQLKSFRPPHTLNPFRSAVADIMNVQHTMLGTSRRSSWPVIRARIEASKESEDGISRNLDVAHALFEFAERVRLISYDKPVPKWSVGFGHSVEYWQQFYSVWNGAASFVYFDPRKSSPLNKRAMRFAFSMMHERLRVDDPDFADAELTIFRFGCHDDGSRFVRSFDASNVDLFSRDELNEMITLTYRLWTEELERRSTEDRKATGTENPMGF